MAHPGVVLVKLAKKAKLGHMVGPFDTLERLDFCCYNPVNPW